MAASFFSTSARDSNMDGPDFPVLSGDGEMFEIGSAKLLMWSSKASPLNTDLRDLRHWAGAAKVLE